MFVAYDRTHKKKVTKNVKKIFLSKSVTFEQEYLSLYIMTINNDQQYIDKVLEGDSKFSTWLYKITYNNCIDRVKKVARKYHTDTIDEVNENKIKAIEDTLQIIEREERAEVIKECMEALPEDERTILWLFYFEELSLKEIIDVTSYSESNIKVKLHRARKRLLSIVKEKVEPELINHYGR